jgi:ParB family chromosome partitioning protein
MGAPRKKREPAAGPRKPRRTARRARREEAARGAIAASEAILDVTAEPELGPLAGAIRADGGAVLGSYRDPLAGRPLLLASLPLDRVQPTPYQRDVSPAHVERLADAIAKTGLYLDPIVAFHDASSGRYHTPNGGHRTEAMRRIGARAITALVVPDARIAYRILALNTEKAHNLKERSLEVIKMARSLATLPGSEADYAAAFEEASFVTLGAAYEKRPRLSGAVYHPVVRRTERFSTAPLRQALGLRERHADQLLALDDEVTRIVDALKERGLQSPYLRAFVVARINPLRFVRGKKGDGEERAPDFDATLDKMLRAATRFDPARIEQHDLARTGGAPAEESD